MLWRVDDGGEDHQRVSDNCLTAGSEGFGHPQVKRTRVVDDIRRYRRRGFRRINRRHFSGIATLMPAIHRAVAPVTSGWRVLRDG